MAYSGKYRVENPSKYKGDHTNVIYRSLWERWCFKWADSSSDVRSWSSEEVVIPYLYEVDRRAHRYFVDLKVTFTNGETWLIEIKPKKETLPPEKPKRKTKRYISESLTYVKNQNKWKAAVDYAENRKWKFVIWTEDDLQRMGIMPKKGSPFKPLKKLPKYPAYSRTKKK